MRELDALKEELTYLRLWLGMTAVADVSLIGWTASALETASARLLCVAIVVIMVLGVGILLFHRMIGSRIGQIRSL